MGQVAQQLVKTAALKRMTISYMSDEQTLDGDYQWNTDSGIALYTFKPPYEAIAVSPQGRRLGS